MISCLLNLDILLTTYFSNPSLDHAQTMDLCLGRRFSRSPNILSERAFGETQADDQDVESLSVSISVCAHRWARDISVLATASPPRLYYHTSQRLHKVNRDVEGIYQEFSSMHAQHLAAEAA